MPNEHRFAAPDISVVLCTYNRAEVLPRALDSLLDQDADHARYEIVVVNNNSTDRTHKIVESFCNEAPNVRSVFEQKQGLSYARNTGILTARAPLIAFTDDDVRVSPDWVSTILRLFAEHPDAVCVGGKILPNWSGPWPTWLTREHWSPLALLDFGDCPFYVNSSRPLCLLGANSAYRREVFDRIGMFALHVQAVGREVATEDHELLLRVYRSGAHGYYYPQLTVVADIAPERMERRYHRRWSHRHGHFSALMRDQAYEAFNRSRYGHLLGVPAHFYRRVLRDLGSWLSTLAQGRFDAAFIYEVELWSHAGFLRTCWQDFFSSRRNRFMPAAAKRVLHKAATAQHVFQTTGSRGVLRVSLKKLLAGKRIARGLRWCKSRYVELRGNNFTLDGCRFSVDSPVIRTELKEQFVADRYERAEREMVKQYLDPALPVVELGGAIGVVACLTNRKLANPRAHVVVEANPDLIPLLERNRDRNGCSFNIVHRAIAYGGDEVTFYRNVQFYSGNTFNAWNESPGESIRVPTTGLRRILDHFGFDRCALICDIEGGEFDLIDHEADTLRERVVTLMVEVHEQVAPEVATAFFPKLERIGFSAIQKRDGTYVLQNAGLV